MAGFTQSKARPQMVRQAPCGHGRLFDVTMPQLPILGDWRRTERRIFMKQMLLALSARRCHSCPRVEQPTSRARRRRPRSRWATWRPIYPARPERKQGFAARLQREEERRAGLLHLRLHRWLNQADAGFPAELDKLEAADTQVLGVSMDSPFSNQAWAEQHWRHLPVAE